MRRAVRVAIVLALVLVPACSSSERGAAEDSSAPLEGTIVYSAEVDGNVDIFRAEIGEAPQRLTTDAAREFDPALSPDGDHIAYRRNAREGSDEADIWIMDRSGGNQRNVTESAEDSNWSPAWTPDGRIIFSSMRGGGPALELWVMEPDGRGVEQVATGWCEYPSAAPDGSAYVCSSPVGGAYDLVVVSAEGVRTPLTTTPASEFGASWSPDGRWIAFSRDLGDRWSLLQIRPDGTDEREVAREGVFPTWTPDGRLAWTGPGGINVAGTDPSRPTVVDLPAEFPSWGP